MFFHFSGLFRFRSILFVFFGLNCGLGSSAFAAEYALQAAIQIAQSQDPWLQKSQFHQQNLVARSISAGTLPDPVVHLGVANLPLDSFSFSQEGMTQLKVGVSQMIPRGDSRALQQAKLEQLSLMQPLARADRKAQVAVSVAHLWLEVFRHQKTMALIEQDRGLFEHLVDLVQSSYSSATGGARQQDFVRAQLELTRLEDRLSMLLQQRDKQLAKLSEWLGYLDNTVAIEMPDSIDLSSPSIDWINAPEDALYLQRLTDIFNKHPKISQINQKVDAAKTGILLAHQSYQPQWGLNASYGLRGSDSMGNNRADLFSFGMSLDIPLFTDKRQDQQVRAAMAEQQAILSERALALRQLRSGFAAAKADYVRLTERKALFDERLLLEMTEQAEAALTAYTNGEGDFAEVVRARIGELNARIDALQIEVDRQKSLAQLHYFLVGGVSHE